jgi:hypothetical protein
MIRWTVWSGGFLYEGASESGKIQRRRKNSGQIRSGCIDLEAEFSMRIQT